MSISIVSAIILVDNKLVCLDHKKVGKITLPMGKVEINECPSDAIDRELYEELGIEVTKKCELELLSCPHHSSSRLLITNHVFYIEEHTGEIINGEPQRHSNLYNLTKEELTKLVLENKLDSFLTHLVSTYLN